MPGSSNNQVEPVEGLARVYEPLSPPPPQNFPRSRNRRQMPEHMLVSGRCCRLGFGSKVVFAFLEVHAFNETVSRWYKRGHTSLSEKDTSPPRLFHGADELWTAVLPAFLVESGQGVPREDQTLAIGRVPVGPNLFSSRRPTPALPIALGQLTFLTHERPGALSISRMIKGRVLPEAISFLCIRHESFRVVWAIRLGLRPSPNWKSPKFR